MDHSLNFEAVVAPSDFDPTSTRPAATGSPVGQVVRPPGDAGVVRPSAKEWAVDRPLRRSLLELGLAVGPDAAAWEAGMMRADARLRATDRRRGGAGPAAGDDAAAATAADKAAAAKVDAGTGAGTGAAAEPLSQQALLAMASEVQTLHKQRQTLAEELAALERRQAELEAKIVRHFDRCYGPGLPAAPEPPAPPPGTGLPMHAWSRRA